MGIISPSVGISIHALVKRATYAVPPYKRRFHISIHALVKRATVLGSRCSSYISDFNPRPREEGDLTAGDVPEEINISIHALVKRATGLGWG